MGIGKAMFEWAFNRAKERNAHLLQPAISTELMKRTLPIFIVLSFLVLQACSGTKFQQDIEVNHPANDFGERVDSIVAGKMNQYNIPGLSIGLVMEDSIIYTKGYGIKSIENPEPVTEISNFHTASISKLFTAQAVVMLLAENDISLNERLLNIIPELRYEDQRVEEITIKSLLNHTSGLPDVSNYHWKNKNHSASSLKEYISGLKLTLDSQPGNQYQYSSLGYNILGYVVEKLSESSFEEFVNEKIFDVSGMDNSDFRYFEIPDSIKTSPHSKKRITKKVYTLKTYPYTREHAPGSTLNSSAADLSKWMISFLKSIENNEPNRNFTKMINPGIPSFPYIGLGFQLSSIDSKKTIGHFGGDKGYRSYLLMIPDKKMGLVVLANSDYNEDFRQEILHPIAKIMLDKHQADAV
jgi:CubicO group peptidase (beta-lactamase class C family)